MPAEARHVMKAHVALPAGVVVESSVEQLAVPLAGFGEFSLSKEKRRTESTEPVTLRLEVPGAVIRQTAAALRELADALEGRP